MNCHNDGGRAPSHNRHTEAEGGTDERGTI